MLESTPSADTGGMTEGQGLWALPFFFLPLLIPLKALNSGGIRGQSPLCLGTCRMLQPTRRDRVLFGGKGGNEPFA